MPKKNDMWFEWAAYNLAFGISEADVKAEMLKNGLTSEEIDPFTKRLSSDSVYKAALRLARNYRLSCSLNDALLELECQAFDFTRIKRVPSLSSEAFHTEYYAANHPVIMEDIVPHWPASSNWSLENLRRRFGRETIVFQRGRSPSDHRDAFVDHTVEATFNDFLDCVEQAVQHPSSPYLIAHDRLLERRPFDSLLDDLHFDPRYFAGDNLMGRVFLWVGGPGSRTPMHRDLGNVYLAQIMGQKVIRMVPSKQLHLMYNEAGYHSEADFEALGFEDFPLLKDAYIVEETIQPGDLLFIPIGWWHCVRSVTTTITVTGNNFRFPNQFKPIF